MKIKNNISKILLLGIFVLSLVFTPNDVDAVNYYGAGSLIKIKGVKGAAVYQIGEDGKKYIFPDQKTFETWHDDFSGVLEVDQDDIDGYDDGGTVTFQPGTKLITHRNTAKVYAVGEDGEVTHIPDEATALRFYGSDWSQLVSDIDPGIFAIAYRITKKILSENSVPEGSLIEDEETGDYYLIEDGQKRKVRKHLLRLLKLHKKFVLKIKRLADLNNYDDGDDVDEDDEDDINIFAPGDKVVLCHKPGRANVTIRVSQRALIAHLAHGDTRGACSDDDSDDSDDSDDDDDDSDDSDDSDDDDVLNVDLSIEDIILGNEIPSVNATTTITAHVKNSGDVSLSDPDPIFNVLVSFQDFTVESVSTSTVSSGNLLDPGESASIEWTGYFESDGEKTLSVTADYADSLDESDEANNTRIESVIVLAEGSPDLIVDDIAWDPESPLRNVIITITAYIKNSGDVALTHSGPAFDVLTSFEDFVITDTEYSTVSIDDPLEPEESATIVWTGRFDDNGDNKRLSVTVDNDDILDESDDSNNTLIEYVDVL